MPQADLFSPHRILSFARRIGRALSHESQQILQQQRHLLLPPMPEQAPLISMESIFGGAKSAYMLEIGFGHGEHLVACAKISAEWGIIGCEPFINGVAHAMRHAAEAGVNNLRIWPDDVLLFLKCCPDHVFSRIYILFPDPWPKQRHHKRRIVSAPILALLAKKMAPGGALLIATDHAEYAEWIQERLHEAPAFRAGDPSLSPFLQEPGCSVITRYQQKALVEGAEFHHFFYTV